jgi:hypothetical protein
MQPTGKLATDLQRYLYLQQIWNYQSHKKLLISSFPVLWLLVMLSIKT